MRKSEEQEQIRKEQKFALSRIGLRERETEEINNRLDEAERARKRQDFFNRTRSGKKK